jgi:hypothetical protein
MTIASVKARFMGAHHDSGSPETDYQWVFRKTLKLEKLVDAAASTLTNRSFHRNPTAQKFKLRSVFFVPDAALTASDTVFATLTLSVGTAGALRSAATVVTNVASGSWVEDVPKALVLSATAANTVMNAGDILNLDIAKASTGTVVPQGALVTEWEPID